MKSERSAALFPGLDGSLHRIINSTFDPGLDMIVTSLYYIQIPNKINDAPIRSLRGEGGFF